MPRVKYSIALTNQKAPTFCDRQGYMGQHKGLFLKFVKHKLDEHLSCTKISFEMFPRNSLQVRSISWIQELSRKLACSHGYHWKDGQVVPTFSHKSWINMLGLSEVYFQYSFLSNILLSLAYGINYVIKNLTWQQHLGFSPLHTPGLFDLTLHLPPAMLLPEDHAQLPPPLPPWEGTHSV